MTPHEPITIVIAVTVRLYRDGLAAALGAHDRLRVAATAATALEARAAARDHRPDVLIVDVSFDDVLDVMRTLRAESGNSRILAFGVRDEIASILEYAEAGAEGFVTANGSVHELVEVIERTHAGELLCSPRIAAELLRRAALRARQQCNDAGHLFTGREQQVFSLLKQGRSNKEIACALSIAEATVKNHVHHVLEKLQVNTRGQAAVASPPPLKATLGPVRPSRRAG